MYCPSSDLLRGEWVGLKTSLIVNRTTARLNIMHSMPLRVQPFKSWRSCCMPRHLILGL
uniref:Uncharacterized protein n=1 Tax=Anguilla anguilla TaxID=7936 RepID=A0A0E9QBJ4_ANGAN